VTTPLSILAKKLKPRLRARFEAALQALQGNVNLNAVAQAVQHGHMSKALDNVLRAVDPTLQVAALAVREAVLAGADAEAATIMAHVGKLHTTVPESAFTVVNHDAVEAATKAQTAQLVREVGGETKDAIRSIVKRSVSGDLTAEEAARLIRAEVGLTTRQAAAVDRYLLNLLHGGTPGSRAMNAAERYARKLLRQRSESIAVTEVGRATESGARTSRLSARRKGPARQARARAVGRHVGRRAVSLLPEDDAGEERQDRRAVLHAARHAVPPADASVVSLHHARRLRLTASRRCETV
jgi:hypothetical protein